MIKYDYLNKKSLSYIIKYLLFIFAIVISCGSKNLIPKINNIAVNPEGILFVGTNSGIYKLAKNNSEWMKINELKPASLCYTHNGCIYAGTMNGLFQSKNQGNTWEKVRFLDSYYDGHGIIIEESNNKNIFLGTSLGIFFSQNNRLDWHQTQLRNVGVKFIDFNKEGHIFAGSWTKGLHKSIDNGKSWQLITDQDLNPMWITAIALSKNGQIFISTDSSYVLTSINNGKSWEILKSGFVDGSIDAIFCDSNDYLYAANNFTFYYSKDLGINWIKTNSVIKTDIYESDNKKKILDARTNTKIIAICFVENSDGSIVAGTYENGVFISKDKGRNWIQLGQFSY